MTHRRIEFVVYPPDYTPGRDKFKVVRSRLQVKKAAQVGAEVHRCVHVHPGKRQHWVRSYISHVYTLEPA